MLKSRFLFIILIGITHLFSNVQCRNYSPTQRYLFDHPIEEIKNYYNLQNKEKEFTKLLPFFHQVIQNEASGDVIGYHGSTQNYRIFQDILRAVFEEVLEYKIPKDFHFLRVPGKDAFDLKQEKGSFFELFGRKQDQETLDLMVKAFLFFPIKKKFGCKLTIANFTHEQQEVLRNIFIDFARYLDTLESPFHSFLYETESKSSEAFTVKYFPTGNKAPQLLTHKNEIARKVSSLLCKMDQIAFYKSSDADSQIHTIAQILEEGFKQEKIPISVDILEEWLEGILGGKELLISFWNMCQFPELEDNEYKQIEYYVIPFLDTRPEQQLRVICLNIPLFGNYFRWDESSIMIFLENWSIEGGDHYVIKELSQFFEEIGLNPILPYQLFAVARDLLSDDKGSFQGCLFQFFDNSLSYPYEATNLSTYASFDFGFPLYHVDPADVIIGNHPLRTKAVDLQLRLLMSNYSTLNPYGNFRILRYDSVDLKNSELLMQTLRDELRDVEKNPVKIHIYKEKLESYWSSP